jgi:hypothetical protein
MVHCDGTVCNSLGDLIQFVYGEDGMDEAFIECQKIETFGLVTTKSLSTTILLTGWQEWLPSKYKSASRWMTALVPSG